MKTVVVYGGRDYDKKECLFTVMDFVLDRFGEVTVVHGAAPGADTLAGLWAEARGQKQQAFPADWEKYGRAAGPIRNRQMIEEGKPTLGIEFPGGKGTKDMASQLDSHDINVIVITDQFYASLQN